MTFPEMERAAQVVIARHAEKRRERAMLFSVMMNAGSRERIDKRLWQMEDFMPEGYRQAAQAEEGTFSERQAAHYDRTVARLMNRTDEHALRYASTRRDREAVLVFEAIVRAQQATFDPVEQQRLASMAGVIGGQA